MLATLVEIERVKRTRRKRSRLYGWADEMAERSLLSGQKQSNCGADASPVT